jgi:hypothetical protein
LGDRGIEGPILGMGAVVSAKSSRMSWKLMVAKTPHCMQNSGMHLIRWLFGLFLVSGVYVSAQDASSIPIRTLPEVGYGPALLVGVEDYDARGSAFDPLPGIGKDLSSIEGTVRKLGWQDVTVLRNPSLEQLRTAVDGFGPKARASDGASFFYYSGHGVLQDKLNYMIPAKAQVRTRGHLGLYALPVEDLLAYLGVEGSGPALVFVDACRNNTLPAEGKSSKTDLLLSRRAGMFIGFATAEGTISNASDRGSVYTRSLAQRLLTPGMSLDDLYAGIIADVEQATKDRASEIQPPEKQSALRFVLHMLPGNQKELMELLRAENEQLKRAQSVPGSTKPTSDTRHMATLEPEADPFGIPSEPTIDTIFEGTRYAHYSETARSAIMRKIQSKLRDLGYYLKSVDGVPGPATSSALAGFQSNEGMQPSGKLDTNTLQGLGLLGISESLVLGGTMQTDSGRRPGSDGIPIGIPTDRAGFVRSPYKPSEVIDVTGFRSGDLVLDPYTDNQFRMP